MAQEKGPQDELAQVEFLRHDRPELIDADLQDAAGGRGPGRQEGTLAAQKADLAQELRGPVGDENGLVGPTVVLDDLGSPFENDDEVVGLVTGGEEELTGSDGELAAVGPENVDLRGIEDGGAAGLEVGDPSGRRDI